MPFAHIDYEEGLYRGFGRRAGLERAVLAGPALGIPLHWLGGLASGSFYVPYRSVKHWSWEIYWLLGGVFSWIVCPWLFASVLTRDLPGVILHQPLSTLGWTYFFGILWGLGGMTYGLTMRYLGLSLGTGVALGFCAIFGTLLPPVAKSFWPSLPGAESISDIVASTAGRATLSGVLVCALGIAVASYAGLKKDRELAYGKKQQAIAEFNLARGLLVATFCGVMSACFAFALTAANPVAVSSLAAGTDRLWSGLPKLVVLLWGGFTTNCIWCALLIRRNRTLSQYVRSSGEDGALQAGAAQGAEHPIRVPLLRNYLLCALGGTVWYLQFFFYTMGETQMGRYAFSSWTVHMASIIIFATIWGWIFKEWSGASRKVHTLVLVGITLLIGSTLLIGLGAYLNGRGAAP